MVYRQTLYLCILFILCSLALSEVSVVFRQPNVLGRGKVATVQFTFGKEDIALNETYEFGHISSCNLLRDAELVDFIAEPSFCFSQGKKVAVIRHVKTADGGCEVYNDAFKPVKVFTVQLTDISSVGDDDPLTFSCEIAVNDDAHKLSASPEIYLKRQSSPQEEEPAVLASKYPRFVTPKVETFTIAREKVGNAYDLTIGVNAIGTYQITFPDGYTPSFPEGFFCRSNIQPGVNTARFFAKKGDTKVDLDGLHSQHRGMASTAVSPYELMKQTINGVEPITLDDQPYQYFINFREADTVHCDVSLSHPETLYDSITFELDTVSFTTHFYAEPGIVHDVNEDEAKGHVGHLAVLTLYVPKTIDENDYYELRINKSTNSVDTLHKIMKPVVPLPKDFVLTTFPRGFLLEYKGGPLLQSRVIRITFEIDNPPEQDNVEFTINLYRGTRERASGRSHALGGVSEDNHDVLDLYPVKQTLYLRAVLAQSTPTWELIEDGKRVKTSVDVTALYTKQNKHWLTHFYLTDAYQDADGVFDCAFYNKSQKETAADARVPVIHVDHGSIHAFIEEDLAKDETMVISCIFPLLYPNFVGYNPWPGLRKLRIGTWSWDKTTDDGNALYYGFGGSPGIGYIDVTDAPNQEVVALRIALPYPTSLTNEREYLSAASKVFTALNAFKDEHDEYLFNQDLSVETTFGLINHPLLNLTGIHHSPYTAVDVESLNGGIADTLIGVATTDKVTVDNVNKYLEEINTSLGDTGMIREVKKYTAYDSSRGLDGCGSPMQRKCLFDGPCKLHTNCGGNGECYQGLCTDLGVLYNPFSSAMAHSLSIALIAVTLVVLMTVV